MLRASLLVLLCGCAAAPQVLRPDTVARLGTRTFDAPLPRVWAALRDVLEEGGDAPQVARSLDAGVGLGAGALQSALARDAGVGLGADALQSARALDAGAGLGAGALQSARALDAGAGLDADALQSAPRLTVESAQRSEAVVVDGATVVAARSDVWTLEALSPGYTRVTAAPRLVLGARELSQLPLFVLRDEERAWAAHFRALEAALALRAVGCRTFAAPPERTRLALVAALKAAHHFITAQDAAGARLHTSRRILVGAGGYSAFSRDYDAQLSADGEGTAVCLLPTLILLSAGEVTVPREQLDVAIEARSCASLFKALAEGLSAPAAAPRP